jgi:peptide/nickel transport system substrate-binding protein
MALSLDRQAFIDTVAQGEGEIGGVLQPPPGGLWGMPAEQLKDLPGYDPDVAKNRAPARQIMEKLGYGPNNPLKIKVSASDIRFYRDPAILLIDQLRQIYIEAELERSTTAATTRRSCARSTRSGSICRPAAPIPIRSSICSMAAAPA